jgi:hypothetical protein
MLVAVFFFPHNTTFDDCLDNIFVPLPHPNLYNNTKMLFTKAATSNFLRSVSKRAKSTLSGGEQVAGSSEKASSAATGLVAAVGTTFGTYMLADFLSNFIQHPTQKVSEMGFVFALWRKSTGKSISQPARVVSSIGFRLTILFPFIFFAMPSQLDGLRVLQSVHWP